MTNPKLLQSYGSGIIIGDPDLGPADAYVYVGNSIGPADTWLDGDDVQSIGTYDYTTPDINGLRYYTVDQRAISMLPEHAGTVPTVTQDVPVALYTPVAKGVLRVNVWSNASFKLFINGALSWNGSMGNGEDYSRAFALKAGDVVTYSNDYTPGQYQAYYKFLPYQWPPVA